MTVRHAVADDRYLRNPAVQTGTNERPGAHIERDGQPRPPRTPSHKEHQQAERTGVSPKQAKELITEIWRSTDNGKSFQAALEDKGWLLARGDRRDFVAIDPKGGTHSLARRIEGAAAKDVRARLSDLDPRLLPSVAAAARATSMRKSGSSRRTTAAKSGKGTCATSTARLPEETRRDAEIERDNRERDRGRGGRER